MIVIDASAMLEALVGHEADRELLEALAGDVVAPHLLDVEVLSGLHGLLFSGKLGAGAAENARHDYFAFTITRHEVGPLSDRIWQLRHQYTSYGACYLALAQAVDAPLYTCDAKLAAGGHDSEVRVLPLTH